MPRHDPTQTTCKIPAGSTTSNRLELKWYEFDGITVPVLTTGNLTVQVSNDDALYLPVYDAYDTQVLIYHNTSGSFGISSEALRHVLGYQFMRFVTSVTQVSAVTFEVRFKDNIA